ncbi:3'-5' exonuclease-like [Miscanthus floridulus]|uniref:3'-5' exonuclease-like n=1 Tax=Miscanthus floridulus TaxID=154761 RepID=UPI0034599DDC
MALLQIYVRNQCLLFQVGIAGTIPDCLKRFLAGKGHMFVGVAIVGDMERLWLQHNIKLSKAVELQAMAPFIIQGKWRKVASLVTLGRDLLDVDIEFKGTAVHFKNWHLPRLTEEQIKYATSDAFISHKIWDKLQSKHGFDLHIS